MQLELFQFEQLSDLEFRQIFTVIRQNYWRIRNLRGGRFGQARLRHHYRIVATYKEKLLLAGMGKREVLDLLLCCRGKCSERKPPFRPCRFCTFPFFARLQEY